MKTLFSTLSLFLLAFGALDAQQRVVLGTTNDADATIPFYSTSRQALMQANPGQAEVQPFVRRNNIPSFMAAEVAKIGYSSFDALYTFAGLPIDTTRFLVDAGVTDTIGIGDLSMPANLGDAGNAYAHAQIFPAIPGSFVIDTLVFTIYPGYDRNAQARLPLTAGVKIQPFLYRRTVAGLNILKNHRIVGDYNVDSVINLLDEFIIPKDTVNSKLNLATNLLSQTIYPIPTGRLITIPANTNFGLLFIPENETDDVEMLAQWEWYLPAAHCMAGYVAKHPLGDSLHIWSQSGLVYTTNPKDAAHEAKFPNYYGKTIRKNIRIRAFGTFDGQATDSWDLWWAARGAVSVEEVGAPQPLAIQSVTPNPMTETGKMTFSLERPATVEITIINSVGQKVGTIANSFMAAGTFSADVDASNLAAGMYSIVLNAGGFRTVAPMSVVR